MFEVILPHPKFNDEVSFARLKQYQLNDLISNQINLSNIPLSTKLTPGEFRTISSTFSVSRTEASVKTLVEAIFPILDKAFFFDRLSHELRGIRYIDSTSPMAQSPSQPGFQVRGMYSRATNLLYINIDMSDQRRRTLAMQFISLLLHEMTHAFLALFTCDCEDVCGDMVRSGLGTTHHGPRWCDLIVVVKEALRRDLGWDVDLGIRTAVQLECEYGFVPRVEDLTRWGLRWSRMRRGLLKEL